MIKVIGQPFVDNLAGWFESDGLQIDQYPRFGSFKENDLELMKSMVKKGWGDPQWDYKYMSESYEIWIKIRIIWNQGPERINKASKISKDLPSTVKTPPDCCVCVYQRDPEGRCSV